MARAAAILLVALLAGAFASQAQAALQMCDPKGTPAVPRNLKVDKSVITPQGPAVKLSWDSGTTEKTGCVEFWRVITYVNGVPVREESAKPNKGFDATGSYTHVYKLSDYAGKYGKLAVYAVNNKAPRNPNSATASTPEFTFASGGATTNGRKML